MSRKKTGRKQPPRTLQQLREEFNVALQNSGRVTPELLGVFRRLQVESVGPYPFDAKLLAESIEASPNYIVFFCDSTVFIGSTDARLWQALLQ